jgi:hypothetical protein
MLMRSTASRTPCRWPRKRWNLIRAAPLTRYQNAYPELFAQSGPSVQLSYYRVAIDLALVLQKRGDGERASALRDGAARVIRTYHRMGAFGCGISDVAIQRGSAPSSRHAPRMQRSISHPLAEPLGQSNKSMRPPERGHREGLRTVVSESFADD